jgi:TRAP-type mannitol/chloroaromatic compound transport system permease small subunit
MNILIRISAFIDRINTLVGRSGMWLILLATVISALNAIVRKLFGVSSNAFLEIQWYLFSAVFMLGGAYGLLTNSHVRIDFISARFSARTRNWIDIFGILFVITPVCLLLMHEGWPLFVNALESGEQSSNSGGLIRWPVLLLIPLGFCLLLLQGFSELVKRIAFLQGRIPDPLQNDSQESADT